MTRPADRIADLLVGCCVVAWLAALLAVGLFLLMVISHIVITAYG